MGSENGAGGLDEVGEGIRSFLQGELAEGDLVTKFVIVYEAARPTGERGCGFLIADGVAHWDAMGMLEWAKLGIGTGWPLSPLEDE